MKGSSSANADELLWFSVLALAAAGAVFYFTGYRSFWIDEAMLGIAINNTSLSDLLQLKNYEQATPLLHFLISKAILVLWGNSDTILRIPSIVVFSCATIIALSLLKTKSERITLLALVFGSTEIVRYSTEFKHYIFEFSVSLTIIMGWLNRETNFGRKVYFVSIFASPFIGYSPIFIVTSTFVVGCVHLVRNTTRSESRNWYLVHLAYFLTFLLIHFLVNQPGIQLQINNWPEAYMPGLLSENWKDPATWKRLPDALLTIFPGKKFARLALLAFSLSMLLFVIRKHNNSLKFSQLIHVLITSFILIFAASLAGKYPIQLSRHFLFLSPLIIMMLVFSISSISIKSKYFGAIFIILFAYHGTMTHNKKGVYFQETKRIIHAHSTQIDVVFVGALPAYQWYTGKNTDDTSIVGFVNSISAPRIVEEARIETFSAIAVKPGSWPWIWSLKNRPEFSVYLNWLANSIANRNVSRVLFTHHDDEQMSSFINSLSSACTISTLDSDVGATLLSIECPAHNSEAPR